MDDYKLLQFGDDGVTRELNVTRYCEEIKQRLLPVLLQMNTEASQLNKKLRITLPDLGYEGFRDPLHIYSCLNEVLKMLIKNHASLLTHVVGLYFDTYKEVLPREKTTIGHIEYECVASRRDKDAQAQLELSQADQGNPDILLGTIVAADPLSWMGNDMWVDSRKTDEGVKAGSTTVLPIIATTVAPGQFSLRNFNYDANRGHYVDAKKRTWQQISGLIRQNPYASDKTPIRVFDHNGLVASNRWINTAVGAEKSGSMQTSRVQNKTKFNHAFCFKFLASIAAVSAAALAVGVCVLSMPLVPAAVGAGTIVLALLGVGLVANRLFSKKNALAREGEHLPVPSIKLP